MRKLIILALTATAVSGFIAVTGPSANACGLIGCIVNNVVPGAGDRLDDWHAQAGRPLDHAANQAAGAAANSVAPGSGPAVTQALEYRDIYNRGGYSTVPGRWR